MRNREILESRSLNLHPRIHIPEIIKFITSVHPVSDWSKMKIVLFIPSLFVLVQSLICNNSSVSIQSTLFNNTISSIPVKYSIIPARISCLLSFTSTCSFSITNLNFKVACNDSNSCSNMTLVMKGITISGLSDITTTAIPDVSLNSSSTLVNISQKFNLVTTTSNATSISLSEVSSFVLYSLKDSWTIATIPNPAYFKPNASLVSLPNTVHFLMSVFSVCLDCFLLSAIHSACNKVGYSDKYFEVCNRTIIPNPLKF